MRVTYLIAGAVAAMLLAPQAHAFSVIDTIDGTQVAGGEGISDGTSIAAQSFNYAFSATPGAGLNVTVDLANLTSFPPGNNFQSSTGSVVVYLVANTGGGLGVAGTPTFPTSGSGASAVVTGLTNDVKVGTIAASTIAASPTGLTITPVSLFISPSEIAQIEAETANNEYWLVLSLNNAATGGTSNIDWIFNSGTPAGTGVAGQAFDADGINGTDLIPDNVVTDGPFDVSINAPEPASLALIGSAITALGLIRRRRRSRPA
jgi:hypothetical protein